MFASEIKGALKRIFDDDFDLLLSGFDKGDYNMQFDFERTEALAAGKSKPMFRLYGWNPWAVSLGYNQNESDINYELCRQKGFDLVRRPTGGRAVLHADELTYSVVTKLNDGSTAQDVYRDIHILLLEAFLKMGCDNLDFHKSQPDFKDFYKREQMSVSCFASSARYEVTFKGRKIVGSAQRLFGNTLLQHGSIILDRGHEEIADVANLQSPEARSVFKRYVESHSSSLTEASGRKITFDESAGMVYNLIKELITD